MSILFPEDEGNLTVQQAALTAARHNPRLGGEDRDRKRYDVALAQGRAAALAMSPAAVNARISELEGSPEHLRRPQGYEQRLAHSRLATELDFLSLAQARHRRPEPDARAQLFTKFMMTSPERDVGAGAEAFGRTPTPMQLSTRVLATHGRSGYDDYQTARRALRSAERGERSELDRLMAARAAGRSTPEGTQDMADLEQRLEGPRAAVRRYETEAGASFQGEPLAGPLSGDGLEVADNGEIKFPEAV